MTVIQSSVFSRKGTTLDPQKAEHAFLQPSLIKRLLIVELERVGIDPA